MTTKQLGTELKEVVQVRLEVHLRDIYAVAESVDDVQHELFLDAEVLAARKEQFTIEMQEIAQAVHESRLARPH